MLGKIKDNTPRKKVSLKFFDPVMLSENPKQLSKLTLVTMVDQGHNYSKPLGVVELSVFVKC